MQRRQPVYKPLPPLRLPEYLTGGISRLGFALSTGSITNTSILYSITAEMQAVCNYFKKSEEIFIIKLDKLNSIGYNMGVQLIITFERNEKCV